MRCLATILLLLVPAVTSAAPVELSFELEVHVRKFVIDADLLAGARLQMESTGTELVLQTPIEHPWKLYRVSPLVGPAEVKYASDVSLPIVSWTDREKAEEAADRRGRDLWKRHGEKNEFDQAFIFYVIGAPEGRFVVEQAPRGGVSKVTNRVTDRWLPTGFVDWVNGKPVEGYAFWANEPQPPDWQPHTYDALAEALRLLSVPVSEGRVVHPDVAGQARAVMETLMPMTKGRTSWHRDVALKMTATRDGENTVFEGRSGLVKVDGESGLRLTLYRRTTLDPQGLSVSDEVRVELKKDKELSLKLSVGYRPLAKS